MKTSPVLIILSSFFFLVSCSTSKLIDQLDPSCINCKVEKTKIGHWSIYTDIEINAPIEKVWKILTDFKNMPNWSTSGFQGIDGNLVNGERITAKFKSDPEKDKITKYEHDIVVDSYSFGWKGDVFAMGMKDNHFYKLIELENNKTRMIQYDEPNSGMAWLMGRTVSKIMLKGYNKFNNELKVQVESDL